MNHRPHDWFPLAERDPLPGDPAAIRDELAHMRRLAQGLRDQARELRRIASGEGLKGRYATALRGSAADLELRLRQTAERYEHVHRQLTGWADELDDFQATSLTLLRRAHHTDHTPAALHPLRQALTRLAHDRDTRASHYAGRIKRACNDIIKDSPWEEFESATDTFLDNEWADRAFEAASWVVTVAGIAALFVTPAGWVVDLALGLTISLAAKDVLALSVGEGSWFDISMDAVGFLTMATGTVALRSLREIHDGTRIAAGTTAAEQAAERVLEESRPMLDRTYRITNRPASSKASKSAARQLRGAIFAMADKAGRIALQAESDRVAAQATQQEALAFGGDQETATICKDIDRMRSDHDNEAVQKASERADAWKAGFKVSWMVAMGSDGVDKILSPSDIAPKKPSYGPYEDFKDGFVSTIGTGW